jgi:uncharacterized protein (DUF488 family)
MKQVYTLGYEGAAIERFVATLLSAGVATVADVRALPLSRKRGFSKKALAARLGRAGIKYLHFGSLGTPKAGREAAKAGRLAAFRQIYRQHLRTTDAQAALAELGKLARTEPTCLMCFERDPRACHRAMIIPCLGASARARVRHLFVEPA